MSEAVCQGGNEALSRLRHMRRAGIAVADTVRNTLLVLQRPGMFTI